MLFMSITGPFLYTDTIRLSNRDYYLALCYDFILLVN